MDSLADIIREATTVGGKKLSNRGIATLTDVAPETINRIMRNEGTPDVETIDKLADALKLPRARLRAAAGLPRGEAGPYVPPAESRLLDARQRAALDELIRSFVSPAAAAPAVSVSSPSASAQLHADAAAVSGSGASAEVHVLKPKDQPDAPVVEHQADQEKDALAAAARKTPKDLVKDAAGHGDAGEHNQAAGAPDEEHVNQDQDG